MTPAIPGRVRAVLVLGLSLMSAGSLRGQSAEPFLGYAATGIERQRTLEAQPQGSVDTARLRAWSRALSAEPHVAGTPRQRWTTLFVDGLTRGWGLETRIDSFLVYLPHPLGEAIRTPTSSGPPGRSRIWRRESSRLRRRSTRPPEPFPQDADPPVPRRSLTRSPEWISYPPLALDDIEC